MAEKAYLAFDLGAESGRAVLGRLDNEQLQLEEVHRFPNTPVRVNGILYWDVLRLFGDIQEGLRRAGRMTNGNLDGIGCDTWGVDFGLVDKHGHLVANPVHYRDDRTEGMMERVFEIVPRDEVFETTGIQFMRLNTLYQLFALASSQSEWLNTTDKLLLMPDLLNYWLTGRQVAEFTIASTTQMLDPRTRDWAVPMLEKLGIPVHVLPEIVPPATVLGPLQQEIADWVGLTKPVEVIATAGHDTGSAVVAVPATNNSFAYISSGTWSLMGIESATPLINPSAYNYNFTNEGGVNNTIRFLKNIMGLWIVQECRRAWARQGQELNYDQITDMARESSPFVSLINPDLDMFLAPDDMPMAIKEFCQQTSQPILETPGAIVRCVLESLALKYRQIAERIQQMNQTTIEVMHIIGGGTQNKLLNQFAANALGMRVVTGPVEATAIGNILTQAIARGQLADLAAARRVVSASFELESFEPQDQPAWEQAYRRFLDLQS